MISSIEVRTVARDAVYSLASLNDCCCMALWFSFLAR